MELGWLIFCCTVCAFLGWLWRDLSEDPDHSFQAWNQGFDQGLRHGYLQAVEDGRYDSGQTHPPHAEDHWG